MSRSIFSQQQHNKTKKSHTQTNAPFDVSLDILTNGTLASTLAGLGDISSGEPVREFCEEVEVDVGRDGGLAQAGAEDLCVKATRL